MAEMKIAAQKIIPFVWGPINWLTLVGEGDFPESCECEDAAGFPPTVFDEQKDYGTVRIRWFLHKRSGLTKRCVCAMTFDGKPLSFEQAYLNR